MPAHVSDEQLKSKLSEIVTSTFPECAILSTEKITSGLQSKIFKIHLSTHPFMLIGRQSRLKNFEKSIQILSYLQEYTIPIPKVFYHEIWEDMGVSLLEFIPGDTALEYIKKATIKERKTLFEFIGSTLSQIHNVPLQDFWFRKTYPIVTSTDWDMWISSRISTMRNYSKSTFSSEIQKYIDHHLSLFTKYVEDTSHLPLLPLHGDFHLENVHVDMSGKITGIFDFDTAMRGKYYGEIGRFLYALLLYDNDYRYSSEEFNAFLKGYSSEITARHVDLIHGYFLLMLIEKHEIFSKAQHTKNTQKHEHVLRELTSGALMI